MNREQPQLQDLRAATGADVSVPGMGGYRRAAEAWNPLRTGRPCAVVHAATAGEIAATICWARASGRHVVVQRTGHGVHPSGEPVVLIDPRRLSAVSVDPLARTARIGAGVLSGELIRAAAPHGLAPVTGSAPGVSMTGLVTGGGVGPLAHSAGVCADYVRGLTVVTGDGEIHHATATEDPDLFWGLRGGKATLGIVTELELDLIEVPSLWGGCVYLNADDLGTGLRRWADWSARLPRAGTTSAVILQVAAEEGAVPPAAGAMSLGIRFAWLGDPTEGARLADELLDGIAPADGAFRPLALTDIGQIHQDPVDPMPFQEAGFLLRDFDSGAVESLLASAGPGSGSTLTMVEVRALDVATPSTGVPDDAFNGRGVPYNLMTGIVPNPDLAAADAAVRPVLDAMSPWSTGQAMPNFVIGADPERVRLVWDPATRRRLATLGDRHDPDGVLRIGQVARHVPR